MSSRPRWQTERRTKPELGTRSPRHALAGADTEGIDVSAGAASMCDASAASGGTALSSLGAEPSNVAMSVQRRSQRTLLADELRVPQYNDLGGVYDDDTGSSGDEELPGAYAITREDAAPAGLDWDPTDHLTESETCDTPNMRSDIERDQDLGSVAPTVKEKDPQPNTPTSWRWRERKCHIALGSFVVLATAAVVVAFVIMSLQGKASEDAAVSTSPPTNTVDEKKARCDFSTVPAGTQIDFALQCECTQRVGLIIDSVAANYQSVLEIGDLVSWLESNRTIESCSTENLALFWVATDYANAVAEGRSYTEKATRNRFGLANLYLTLEGKEWDNSANWMTATHECDWFGVQCDDNDHVVSMLLPNNNLRGRLDRKLGLFTRLVVLDLSLNDFSSGSIPAELLTLPSITSLNLTSCKIGGRIPELISSEVSWSVSRLEVLQLTDNALTGSIPTSLQFATALKALLLNLNQLSGPLPALVGISNLVTLSLEGSFLSGSIPDSWGDLSQLETLNMASMSFIDGEFTSAFRNLTNLQRLDIKDSSFRGTLPEFLGEMSSLQYLRGSGYRTNSGRSVSLSGAIPTTVGLLTNLVVFDFHTTGLTGPIPSEFGNCSRLETIALSDNAITGTLPSELGNLSSLRSLDLGYTSVVGSMPSEFASLFKLETLDVRGTQITGTVPSAICDSGSSTVVLADTGTLSDCSCCSEVQQ